MGKDTRGLRQSGAEKKNDGKKRRTQGSQRTTRFETVMPDGGKGYDLGMKLAVPEKSRSKEKRVESLFDTECSTDQVSCA